jgi:GTP-binding protein
VSALSPALDRDPRLPRVAIVGRPNVGKSTLFNRLVRARRAIVDDVPGVTRDRVVAEVAHAGRSFLCIDTGGIVVEAPRDRAAMTARVREQTLAALAEADCVVCVFDGAAGLAPEDRETARLLRRSGKRVLWAVNKLDTAGREGLLHDFHATGARDLLPVSGAHGRGVPALLDAIVAALPEAPAAESEPRRTRLALIGRPNVGKSSLLNRLLGEERVIVAPEPGTTRDTVDTPIRVAGRPYVLIDTAGIRRQGRVREPLERHGAVRALGMLERTDLALVVLDASEGLTDQDARIVGRAWEAGRAVILLANKWDLVPRGRRDPAAFRDELAAAHPAFAGLPLLCVSARSGEGLADLFPLVARVERSYEATLPTPALNRELRAAVAATPPPSPGGRAIRLFYVTQTATRPPTVIVFASAPALIPPAYARYLAKRWTTAFRLVGVPLRLRFRDRREAPSGARERDTPARARRNSRPSRGGRRSPRR